MRALPIPFEAALATGCTTLARAWTLTRKDGAVMGFTDHDRPLEIAGVLHEAASGFTATTVEQATGLSADTHEVAGALRSDAISAVDIERGLYDGAEILFSLVDWQDPAARVLVARGFVGEVRRGEIAFEAEVVGLSELMNQPFGRALVPTCALRLGEARCGIDLSAPAYRGTGTVTEVRSAGQIAVSGLEGFESHWFTRGRLAWTSGANQGEAASLRGHRRVGETVLLELWRAPALPIEPGHGFAATAGCDKLFATCREKFANTLNFRGFPHIPGDDWAATYPQTGEAHDGGSLTRS